jgi:peptidoglycan/xylan/chitin deacetylase (PgdA/CDA1 family)
MALGKRAMLGAALSLTGIVRARWWLLPPGLYCFNYHRVGDPLTTEFDRNTFSCSAERFDEHVGFLKENFEVLNLEQLLSLPRDRRPGRKPLALVTFDDGYVDNYSLAFPTLRKYGVSAVFFLPTAFVGTTRIPWWDEIAWLLRRMAGKGVRLKGADEPFSIEEGACDEGIRRVLRFVKTRRMPLEEQVEEVREVCGGARTPDSTRTQLFLNWDQVREMHGAGMDIGSHTHTHRILTGLGIPEQKSELTMSKEILEAELGARITSVAYPVGSASAYTRATCGLAGQVGYRLGFNFLRVRNCLPLRNPLDISRFAVEGDTRARALRSVACFPRLFRR